MPERRKYAPHLIFQKGKVYFATLEAKQTFKADPVNLNSANLS